MEKGIVEHHVFFSPLGAVGHSEFVVIKSSSRLPNPDLFPYLSRRLAASGVEGLRSRDVAADSDTTTTDDADSLDDVDAAAAMLALKHGPRMLTPKKGMYRLLQRRLFFE